MIDTAAENDCLAGFCHNGSWAAVFGNSLLAAFAEDARRPRRRLVEYHDAVGPYIHDNRARIVTYFLEYSDYQWLWMLDNDMQFPADSLYRLIDAAETYDLRLIGAAYWNRYGPKRSYLSWLHFSEEGIRAVPDLPDVSEPVPVTALGMGCTLIHREVLEAVVKWQRDNFPDDPWDSFGADLLRYDDGTAHRMGEDVTFCMRARRQGYEAYGLPTLMVDHYKPSFILPHGSEMNALHDPQDAGGGANGVARHQSKSKSVLQGVQSDATI
jgi:hypothetical protein